MKHLAMLLHNIKLEEEKKKNKTMLDILEKCKKETENKVDETFGKIFDIKENK